MLLLFDRISFQKIKIRYCMAWRLAFRKLSANLSTAAAPIATCMTFMLKYTRREP